MTYDRPRFAHKPVRGERHPDAGPSRRARRLTEAVDRANDVASVIRTRRLAADLGLAAPDRHGTPEGPWRAPYGARNGGAPVRPFRRGVLPMSLRDKLAHGLYPDHLTTKRERTWSEL